MTPEQMQARAEAANTYKPKEPFGRHTAFNEGFVKGLEKMEEVAMEFAKWYYTSEDYTCFIDTGIYNIKDAFNYWLINIYSQSEGTNEGE